MDPRNLWRMRQYLFMLILLALIILPVIQTTENRITLTFMWGGHFSSDLRESALILNKFSLLPILISLTMSVLYISPGIVGCRLTYRCIKQGKSISIQARGLTQIGVTLFIIPLIPTVFTGGMITVSSTYLEGSDFYVNLPFIGILIVTVILAYISYNFRHFGARDFAQKAPLAPILTDETLVDDDILPTEGSTLPSPIISDDILPAYVSPSVLMQVNAIIDPQAAEVTSPKNMDGGQTLVTITEFMRWYQRHANVGRISPGAGFFYVPQTPVLVPLQTAIRVEKFQDENYK